jgi:hypothetical protein
MACTPAGTPWSCSDQRIGQGLDVLSNLIPGLALRSGRSHGGRRDLLAGPRSRCHALEHFFVQGTYPRKTIRGASRISKFVVGDHRPLRSWALGVLRVVEAIAWIQPETGEFR